MFVARVEGCTRALGAPQGWNPETDGYCGMLPIRDELRDAMPIMTSAWEPTPAELEALRAGAKVLLRVVGTAHPPVMVYVGEVPANG
jgi:hypothetical protein